MEKKAAEDKKAYVKPEVMRVKLVVEGPVLGTCWLDDTSQPNSDICNQSGCPTA